MDARFILRYTFKQLHTGFPSAKDGKPFKNANNLYQSNIYFEEKTR